MSSALEYNRSNQALESFLFIGHECFVFKMDPQSPLVTISRWGHAGTDFPKTELCRFARDNWNEG